MSNRTSLTLLRSVLTNALNNTYSKLFVLTRGTPSGTKFPWRGLWLLVGGDSYIFAVKGTFIQFLHCLDIFDIDDAEGLFPWNTEVIQLSTYQEQ